MLEVKNLSVAVQGHTVLPNVSLAISASETRVLFGPTVSVPSEDQARALTAKEDLALNGAHIPPDIQKQVSTIIASAKAGGL